MFAITRNVINDHFRSMNKHKLISLDTLREIISSKKDPEGIVIHAETTDNLSKSLNTLSARERNMVALKFGANLKNKEITHLLGMTESNVGIVLFRAMKKLKKELEGNL